MNQIERIQQMETNLNAITVATVELQEKIEQLKNLRDQTIALYKYYGSETWYSDREAKLPENVKAGVLSEDLIYDSITELRDIAFTMLELGTDVLKNWI